MMYAHTLEQLIELMKNTQQTPTMNVLEHGYMVEEYYNKLIDSLESDNHECSDLYFEYKKYLVDKDILSRYQIYHDCGKPFCKNEFGQFPNHAEYSFNQWSYLFPDDKIVSELMKHDMDFHILRGEDIAELWDNPLAPSLYFTAWAELEANASMFGGHSSDSYKIKKKRLIQAGKKIRSCYC